MVKKQMQLLFAKHSDWLDIVQSFGLEKTLSEDLVQEMYIKIQLKLEKGLDIRYKDDINYYYSHKSSSGDNYVDGGDFNGDQRTVLTVADELGSAV